MKIRSPYRFGPATTPPSTAWMTLNPLRARHSGRYRLHHGQAAETRSQSIFTQPEEWLAVWLGEKMPSGLTRRGCVRSSAAFALAMSRQHTANVIIIPPKSNDDFTVEIEKSARRRFAPADPNRTFRSPTQRNRFGFNDNPPSTLRCASTACGHMRSVTAHGMKYNPNNMPVKPDLFELKPLHQLNRPAEAALAEDAPRPATTIPNISTISDPGG